MSTSTERASGTSLATLQIIVRAVAVVFSFSLGVAACISDPSFQQAPDNADPTTTADPTFTVESEGAPDMVVVPATTITRFSTQALSEKGEPKGKDDGKGKGDDDGKGKGDGKGGGATPAPSAPNNPTPAPSPAPTTSTPKTPTSTSVVVPSFWMDVAPVSGRAYRACTAKGACTAGSCSGADDVPATCVTRAQASAYCATQGKRLVRNDEWTAATMQKPAGLEGLSGGNAEWVDADTGIARGGASAEATTAVGLASSMPSVGFRCAKNR